MTSTIAYVLIAAALATLAGVAIAIHKLRRVHIATYQIANDIVVTRRETEALFGQVHAMLRLERMLDLKGGLPPMRGWAGSPDMLLTVARHVLQTRPRTVMECSSGVSTVVIARCLQLNGDGEAHVYSLEHESAYASKTRALLEEYGLAEWATVIDAPLVDTPGEESWYSMAQVPSEPRSIDLLVVDGPPAGGSSTARYPALPRLKSRMAEAFTVMLDDADRPGERQVVDRWLALDGRLRVERPFAEKGLAVISTT